MKKIALLIGIVAVSNAYAINYADSINDVNMPGGYFAHMDISSVDVSHTNGTITFRINTNGDLVSNNWGKYGLIIDGAAGGTSTVAWNRAFSMAGADYFVGSWVDQDVVGYNQLFGWNGSNWGSPAQVANVIPSNNSVQYTYSWAQLGLTYGSTIRFDAWSSGGSNGDAAWDFLSKSGVNDSNNDGQTGWQEYTESNSQLTYTIPVPEPSSTLALGLGAVALLRRRKK